MAEYLNKHPVETSGAKCEGPKKFQKRKLTQLDPTKFKCKGNCPSLARTFALAVYKLHLLIIQVLYSLSLCVLFSFLLLDTSPLEEPAATQPQAGPSVSLFSNISSPSPSSSSSSIHGSHLGNSFPCPDNCTCHGDVVKCGSLEMVTSSSSISPDEEDLYLDDPSEASNSYTTSDLHKLSKHLNANSNKISLLLCQKGRCIPIDDLNYECKCKNGFSGPFCEQG